MKTLTRTIIVLVIFNLLMVNLAPSQAESKAEGAAETTVGPRRVTAPTPPEPSTPAPVPPAPVPPEPKSVAPTPPAPMRTLTISGRTGLGGVEMQGLPGNVVADPRGYYSATVNYGWRGTVMPVKEGYKFEPASMSYTKLTSNRSDDNYIAAPITLTISGTTGVSGVRMQGLPGGNRFTDENGNYSATVKYGWAGVVEPSKEGFTFMPPNRLYSKVSRDQKKQNYSPRRVGPGPMLGRTGGRKVLVIPDSDVKPEELDALTQDLLVMSHILDERFKESRTIKGVFTDFGDFFGRDSRETEAIYIQGYGALFLMEVNFAFSPPPKEQEKEAEKTEDVDPTWQRAKQKIFSPKGPGGGSDFVSEESYSAEKIDQLKTELIKTLKHASNIRNLKADEWVILTVIGKGRQPGKFYEYFYRNTPPSSGSSTSGRLGRSSSRLSSSRGGGFGGGFSVSGSSASYGGDYTDSSTGGYVGGGYGGMEYGEMGPPSATILTIRAKKSDVDAFAKGELDFEQFQQIVQIFMY